VVTAVDSKEMADADAGSSDVKTVPGVVVTVVTSNETADAEMGSPDVKTVPGLVVTAERCPF
jgi:hypothetical protein